MAPVSVWSHPFKYLQWARTTKPAIYYSLWLGAAGPIMLAVVPPIRHRLGYVDQKPIPLTYPIPPGPRQIPEGYDDE